MFPCQQPRQAVGLTDMMCDEREPSNGSALIMAAAGPGRTSISRPRYLTRVREKYGIGKRKIFQSHFNESDRPLLSMAVPE